MNCLKLRSITGAERLVPFGTAYTRSPEESQVPGVFNCDGSSIIRLETIKKPTLAQELNTEIGAGMGDWIKVLATPVAKLVGKEKCSPCEAKRIIVNAYAKLKAKYGMVEAVRIMKAGWSKAASGDPDGALRDLQEALGD